MRTVNCTALIALISLSACVNVGTSPTSRYYAIDSYHPDRSSQATVIAVGPFELPDYLDRPQIVSRTGEGGLYVSQFERWGEPLDSAIDRRIAGNIGQQFPDAFAYEFTTLTNTVPDLRLVGQIWTFEAQGDGTVKLAASWALRKDGEPTGIYGHNNYSQELSDPSDITEIVAVMAELIDALSADINGGISEALAQDDAVSSETAASN